MDDMISECPYGYPADAAGGSRAEGDQALGNYCCALDDMAFDTVIIRVTARGTPTSERIRGAN